MTLGGLLAILQKIDYKNWVIEAGSIGPDHFFIQVKFYAKDNDKPGMTTLVLQSGRKWLISKHMTDSEVVLTALKAVLTAEEHEAREQFKFKGQRIFDPHTNVEALRLMMATGNKIIGVEPTEHRGGPT